MSTDSEETVRSIAWSETRQLGAQIAKSLSTGEGRDILTEWMAHRVSELIDAADSAPTESDRAKCQDLAAAAILELWEKRSSWPHGWPPADAAESVKAALALHEERPSWQRPKAPTTWIAAMQRLNEIHLDEWRALYFATLVDSPSAAQNWLRDTAQMEADEAELVEAVATMRSAAAEKFQAQTKKARPNRNDRAKVTVDQLEECAKERVAILKSLKQSRIK